jgi:phosphoribosylaminoimidazole-succinocarboxamide synthase
MNASNAVHRTELSGLPLPTRGKVRDLYDLGDKLLLVATDRLSAFDHVLPNPIPDKGRVLHQLSVFWFDRLAPLVPNHLLETDAARFPEPLRRHAGQLAGRAALVRKLEMVPIECVARGYLAGSGFAEYRRDGTVCGLGLPRGLEESSRLPEPIFTPASKAQDGHDENISFQEVERRVGASLAARLRSTTLALYRAGADYALERGIIVADTKFEFGLHDGELMLADEVLTPDSSRFWPRQGYAAGRGQPSYDKQFVRDYLESVGWDKSPPVPELPETIVRGTRERYLEIFRILTGGDPR